MLSKLRVILAGVLISSAVGSRPGVAAPIEPLRPMAFLAGHCWKGDFADGSRVRCWERSDPQYDVIRGSRDKSRDSGHRARSRSRLLRATAWNTSGRGRNGLGDKRSMILGLVRRC